MEFEVKFLKISRTNLKTSSKIPTLPVHSLKIILIDFFLFSSVIPRESMEHSKNSKQQNSPFQLN